ncbi:MAG: winged helix-turn-helix domain-containing protein, partial [Rudaea sp.]
ILDAVWNHRHVTPGVLNRIITLLRQALGESAKQTQYLHTLHGVGYRFDAEVRFGDTRSNPTVEPLESAPMAIPDIHEDGPQSSVPEISAASLLPLAPIELSAPARQDERTPEAAWTRVAAQPPARKRHKPAWIAAMLAVCVALAGALWHYQRSVPILSAPLAGNSVTSAQTRTLIVLPLQTIGATADDELFAAGLGEELIDVLAHVDGLHVIARTSAALVQKGGEDLGLVAQRYGITHALEGSIRHAGSQAVASLRLIDIASGRTLWAGQYERAQSDLFALERSVANSVSTALALKLDANQQASLDRNEDPALYRRYLALRQRGRSFNGEQDVIDEFRKFVKEAPDYARAHGGLALLLVRSGSPDQVEAREEAERALALDPTITDANAALGFVACRADDWERGVTLSKRALDESPADTSVRLGYGLCMAMLGYLPPALEQAQIAYAIDPLAAEVNAGLATMLAVVGRYDEADAHFARFKSGSLRVVNLMWSGDLAAARTLVTPELGRWEASYAAVADALGDAARWPAARKAIDASEQPDGKFNFLRVMDPQADIARNIAALEYFRHAGLGPMNLWLWSKTLARDRQHPAFQDYLHRTHIIDYWRSHGWPQQCKSEGDGARCA